MAEERETGKPGIMGALSRKVGPLPTWAWGLVALVVGIIFIAWRSKSSGSGTTGSTLSSNGVDLSSLVAQGQPMPYYGGDYYQNAPNYPGNSGTIVNGDVNGPIPATGIAGTILPAYRPIATPTSIPQAVTVVAPPMGTSYLRQSNSPTPGSALYGGNYYNSIYQGGNVLIPG